MIQSIIFVSTCKSCLNEQPQDAFTVEDLVRLLDGGYPIEAYCMPCDKFWSIGIQERLELSDAVAVVSKRLLPSSSCLRQHPSETHVEEHHTERRAGPLPQ
jgi:hypothetical protein